jgi:hypothetical protein
MVPLERTDPSLAHVPAHKDLVVPQAKLAAPQGLTYRGTLLAGHRGRDAAQQGGQGHVLEVVDHRQGDAGLLHPQGEGWVDDCVILPNLQDWQLAGPGPYQLDRDQQQRTGHAGAVVIGQSSRPMAT